MTERPHGRPDEAAGAPPGDGAAARDEPATRAGGPTPGRPAEASPAAPGDEASPRPEAPGMPAAPATPVQGPGRATEPEGEGATTGDRQPQGDGQPAVDGGAPPTAPSRWVDEGHEGRAHPGDDDGADGDGPAAEPRPDADPGRRLEPVDAPRLGLVDWVYGVIFAPRATFARLATMERPPLGLLVGVALVVIVASGLVQGAAVARDLAVPGVPGQDPILPADGVQGPRLALAMGVGLAVLGVATLFLGAGLLHLVADLVGGRGSGANLLAALALALLPPNLIGIPLEALTSRLDGAGGALRDLGAVAMVVWSGVLLYHALRATKRLSRTDALIVLFAPWLAVTALAAVLALAVAGLAFAVGG